MNRIILTALLFAVYAAPLNSKEKRGEQHDIAKSAEDQERGTDLPTLWPIYSLTWPAREEKKIEPDWRNPDCQYPHGHEEADLCEQRKMSESAAETVYWNKLQVALSAFGFTALLYTIYLTFRATSAAIESNEIANKTAQRQLRAYIAIDSAHIANFAEGQIPRLECKIRNFGQTPAYKYSTKSFIGIMDRYADHVIDYYVCIFSAKFDVAGYNNGIVGPGGEVILRPRDTVQIRGPEWEGLNTGDFFVYAFGRVQYTDAFDQERFVTYFMHGDRRHSDSPHPVCHMHLYERGNDAN